MLNLIILISAMCASLFNSALDSMAKLISLLSMFSVMSFVKTKSYSSLNGNSKSDKPGLLGISSTTSSSPNIDIDTTGHAIFSDSVHNPAQRATQKKRNRNLIDTRVCTIPAPLDVLGAPGAGGQYQCAVM